MLFRSLLQLPKAKTRKNTGTQAKKLKNASCENSPPPPQVSANNLFSFGESGETYPQVKSEKLVVKLTPPRPSGPHPKRSANNAKKSERSGKKRGNGNGRGGRGEGGRKGGGGGGEKRRTRRKEKTEEMRVIMMTLIGVSERKMMYGS